MQLAGLIVKVAGRCNINCRYCYMYNRADQSYRRLPKTMTEVLARSVIDKAYTHCQDSGSERFEFIFHGGEPLLAEPSFYVSFVQYAKATFGPDFPVGFSVQTNGTLLSESWCALFERLRIKVSVSVDGDPVSHDRNRVDFRGRGTFQATLRGLNLARRYSFLGRHLGVLAVIDAAAPPTDFYRSLKALNTRHVNLLLPDVTHDDAPQRTGLGSDTAYGDWLIAVFDHWFGEPLPKPRIALFSHLIQLILGNDCEADMLGNGVFKYLVIETDGGIEPLDVLKICGDSFTNLGLSVTTHALADALSTGLGKRSYFTHQNLAGQCQQCGVVAVCGGGYLPHRYRAATGFDNPSVYCHDMLKLISHVQNVLLAELPEPLRQTVEPIAYRHLLTSLSL